MKYDDDQCERCGGVRVAKSTLCADCLVKERAYLDKEILINRVAVKMLREKLETKAGLLDDALNYGFKQNRRIGRLLNHIKGLEQKVREVMEDGANRV